MFGLSIGEILVISLFFVTASNCMLTYFCCVKSLRILDDFKSISKAVNKLRIFDQYVLSKVNLVISLFYFVISYLFFYNIDGSNDFILLFSCLLSFVLIVITTFVSRLCYCYTCNILLETKLNEFECFIVNLKRLAGVYLPFVIVSFVVPFIYFLNVELVYKILLYVASLIFILWLWIFFTPKVIVFSNKAKKIERNTLLRYRLEQLFKAHQIKRFELFRWDTSRSKEANAFVSGVRKYNLLVSSTLIEEVTLPELEAIVLHEIGHIKNKHLLKMLIGKLFIVLSIIFMVMVPVILGFNNFFKVLFYVLTIFVGCLELIAGVGVEKKYEMEADSYANVYSDPELFSSALKKVVKNEEFKGNSKFDELFQSHPSIEDRIKNNKKKSDAG